MIYQFKINTMIAFSIASTSFPQPPQSIKLHLCLVSSPAPPNHLKSREKKKKRKKKEKKSGGGGVGGGGGPRTTFGGRFQHGKRVLRPATNQNLLEQAPVTWEEVHGSRGQFRGRLSPASDRRTALLP